MRARGSAQTRSAGGSWLWVLIALIIVGLVLPRLLGAVTDYLFPSTQPGAAQPALSRAVVQERAVYQTWLAALVVWWQSLQRDRE
ncbi:MAG: hypothetical protein ACYC6V_01865 [Bacillota bacterium]